MNNTIDRENSLMEGKRSKEKSEVAEVLAILMDYCEGNSPILVYFRLLSSNPRPLLTPSPADPPPLLTLSPAEPHPLSPADPYPLLNSSTADPFPADTPPLLTPLPC